MNTEELIRDEELSNDEYICYHPTIPLRIFNCFIDTDITEECEINISAKCDLTKLLPILNHYLDWLKGCSQELTEYFQIESGEELPAEWFSSIEVYHFSITFNSDKDYGATISCGESIFSDHSIEFDFDRFEIIDNRLVG